MPTTQVGHIEAWQTTGFRFVTQFLHFLRSVVLWSIVIVLLVYCYARVGFGSLRNMSAYFRGDFVLAGSDVLDLGKVERGKEYTAAFVVRNISSDSVALLGARTCCGCSLSSRLPVTLESNEEAEVTFLFHVTTSQPIGPATRRVLLLLDKGGGSGPVLTVKADVIDAVESSRTESPRL